ncbi:MAG: hypothetical protein L6R41_005360 [Letrouitia leprolyta]|nr:MAG: hypothetical protein L6R41_005360 [Letrouitia leprolyta]
MAPLGNLVRLAPLDLDTLPFHPALGPSVTPKRPRRVSTDEAIEPEAPQKTTQAVNGSEPSTIDVNGRPNGLLFVKAVLDEAITFIDSTLPATFKSTSERSSAPAAAKVQILKREIAGSELADVAWLNSKIPRGIPDQTDRTEEAWFARRSRHENRQDKGTAKFSEFDYSLRVSHSEHEGEYTPDVFDTYKVLEWAIEDDSTKEESFFVRYHQPTMNLFEMCHKLPFPLSTRVFSVLVITAKTGPQDFIVVQIPVDIASLNEAFYSNGRNLKEGESAVKRKKSVLGVYTSIERCVLTANNEVEWTMATASDAKGWLPMWAQRMGIPGAVAKDVGFVVKWIQEHRAKSSK